MSSIMRRRNGLGAASLRAEIGDLSRFENPRKLMAFIGHTPSERTTGETISRGSITKAGNRRARRLLAGSPGR